VLGFRLTNASIRVCIRGGIRDITFCATCHTAYNRLCVCVCACPSIPATTDDAPFALRISIQQNMPIARESVIVAFHGNDGLMRILTLFTRMHTHNRSTISKGRVLLCCLVLLCPQLLASSSGAAHDCSLLGLRAR